MEDEVLTPRVRIRHWRTEDLGPLSEIFAKPEVWRYPFDRAFSAEETEGFLSRRIELQGSELPVPSAAEDRANKRLLGYIALSPPVWLPEVMPTIEIGWRLDPEVWGRGLASEGAKALLDHGFRRLDLPEVLSIYEPGNVASGRVMTKIGIPFDRETVHPFFGRVLHIHRLTRAQWHAGRTQRETKKNLR